MARCILPILLISFSQVVFANFKPQSAPLLSSVSPPTSSSTFAPASATDLPSTYWSDPSRHDDASDPRKYQPSLSPRADAGQLNTHLNHPPSDQAPTPQPPTDQPSTYEPSTDQPSTDQPSTDQPSTDQPSTDQPSTDEAFENWMFSQLDQYLHGPESDSYIPSTPFNDPASGLNVPSTDSFNNAPVYRGGGRRGRRRVEPYATSGYVPAGQRAPPNHDPPSNDPIEALGTFTGPLEGTSNGFEQPPPVQRLPLTIPGDGPLLPSNADLPQGDIRSSEPPPFRAQSPPPGTEGGITQGPAFFDPPIRAWPRKTYEDSGTTYDILFYRSTPGQHCSDIGYGCHGVNAGRCCHESDEISQIFLLEVKVVRMGSHPGEVGWHAIKPHADLPEERMCGRCLTRGDFNTCYTNDPYLPVTAQELGSSVCRTSGDPLKSQQRKIDLAAYNAKKRPKSPIWPTHPPRTWPEFDPSKRLNQDDPVNWLVWDPANQAGTGPGGPNAGKTKRTTNPDRASDTRGCMEPNVVHFRDGIHYLIPKTEDGRPLEGFTADLFGTKIDDPDFDGEEIIKKWNLQPHPDHVDLKKSKRSNVRSNGPAEKKRRPDGFD